MTWSTSDVAVCCSSASFSSRVSRATSVSWLAADGTVTRRGLWRIAGLQLAALRRRA